MNGYINGFSTNGAYYPQWVIRAAVVAVAAATVTVAPTRIAYASAYGDAVVTVTLTETQKVAARATASSSASASATPRVIYAGASTATATATGNGAVRRDVWATAGGDAYCIGEAWSADALGESFATAGASVVLARAHIVHPGRGSGACVASAVGATSDVTRYPTVLAGLGSVVYTRGEASIQKNGESFKRLDGFVPNAMATCTVDVPQDRVEIIVTFGAFDFGYSTGTANTFIRYRTGAQGVGTSLAQPVTATHIHRPTATATATATAEADAIREAVPAAEATARATLVLARPAITHAASGVVSSASLSVVLATAVRTTFAAALGQGDASTPVGVLYGLQHYETVNAVATATATAEARNEWAGAVVALATATANAVAPGVQHRGTVAASCSAVNVQAVSTVSIFGRAQATGTATAARVDGFANSDVLAPDERYMVVPDETRDMAVYLEERTMMVTA